MGASDFAVTGTSGAGVTVVSGTGAAYVVTVSGGGLGVSRRRGGADARVGSRCRRRCGATALVAVTPTGVDERYAVDSTGPSVTLSRADGLGTPVSGAFEVTVRFVEANGLRTSGAGAFTAADSGGDPRRRDSDGHHGPAGVAGDGDAGGGLRGHGAGGPAGGAGAPTSRGTATRRRRSWGSRWTGWRRGLVSVVRADPVLRRTNADRPGLRAPLRRADDGSRPRRSGGARRGGGGLGGAAEKNDADDADGAEPARVFRVAGGGARGSPGTTGVIGLRLAAGAVLSDVAGNAPAAAAPASGTNQTFLLDNFGPVTTITGAGGPRDPRFRSADRLHRRQPDRSRGGDRLHGGGTSR